MTDKEIVHAYIKSHIYMTLATANADGKPEAATVEYVFDGEDLLINTYIHYRKYPNLLQNPRVACVITDDSYQATLQMDAVAQELSGEDVDKAKKLMIAKDPSFGEYFNDETTRFFRITPVWIRLRDYTKKPTVVVEFSVKS